MKRALYSFLLGVVATLAFVVHLPAETIVRYGLKLAAFEAEYDWTALPKEAHVVSYSTRELLTATIDDAAKATAKPKKVAKK